MKRILSLALVFALALTLALPGVAVAKRGGVPASGNGRGNAPVASETGEVADDEAPAKNNGNSGEKGNGDAEAPGKGDTDQARDRVRSQETSGTAEQAQKRTGVENALSRLQSNLERMQADLDAGTRTSLPPGLQRAIAKFMSWLGIEGDVDVEAPDGDESEETSGTVEPGDPEDPDDGVDPDGELPDDEGEPDDGV